MALWCLAVSDGHSKCYYDAQMFIKLQVAEVDRCGAIIETLPESKANKVLRSILTGKAMHVDIINMDEALIMLSDLIQTHEEIELAKAHRYQAAQDRRRQLYEGMQQVK